MCSLPSLSSGGAVVERGCHLLVVWFIRKLKTRMDHSEAVRPVGTRGGGNKEQR